MRVLAHPTLTFAVHEDGTLEVLSPWHPRVLFDAAVLARSDGWRLLHRGDELEIRCTNGRASYALGPPDALGVRAGVLIAARRGRTC